MTNEPPDEVLEPQRPRVRRGQLVTPRALWAPRTNAARNRQAAYEHDTNVHLGAALQMLGLATNRMTELYAHLRGLQLNNILINERLLLDSTGMGTVDAKVSAAAIAVANYGSCVAVVTNQPPGGSPPAAGVGSFNVGAGRMVVLPAAGTVFTVYGRAGEQVQVVLFAAPVPPSSGDVAPARYFPVTLPGASAVLYTTPNGLAATYGGFTVRETAGAAAVFRIRETNVTGKLIETVSLNPLESSRDTVPEGMLTSTDTLFYELVAGTVEGSARVR